MAMTGGNRGGGDMMAEINVTPLVDVMLVLLIIFMVTATLIRVEDLHEREVDMTLPETRDQPANPTDSDNLILRIDSRLQVQLNDDHLVDCSAALASTDSERFEPCFDELQRQIEAHPRAIEEGKVYILAEIQVPYGFVVGSLHRIRVAGVQSVGMVTDPAFLAGLQTTEN